MVLPAIGVPAVVTATGTLLFAVELFPSSPAPLAPQQYTRPPESTAHAEPSAAAALTRAVALPAIGVPAVVTATARTLRRRAVPAALGFAPSSTPHPPS